MDLFSGVAGTVLERWAYVSKASDAKRIDGSSNYVVDVMRNESKYAYGWISNTIYYQYIWFRKGCRKSKSWWSIFKLLIVQLHAESVPGGSLSKWWK